MSDRTDLSDDSVKENTSKDITEKQDCISNQPTYNSVDNSVCTQPSVERNTIPMNSATSLIGSHCLNQDAFPKNWTHVRKLMEKRKQLHKDLFANTPDLTKNVGQENENSKNKLVTERVNVDLYYDMNDFSDTGSSDNENLVIAESGSSIANDNSSVPKCDNNQGICESFRKRQLEEDESPYTSGDSDTDNHDCSDLRLMTPSKINDALNVAIASVNGDVCQKQKKNRIRQVLNKLKMKAECHVPCASPGSASYTISKPLNNLPCTINASAVNLANDKYVLSKDVNGEKFRQSQQSPDVVKYFGLPYTSSSKPPTYTDLTHNEPIKSWMLNRDLPQTIDISAEIPTELGDCGSTNSDLGDDEPIDYTNIAFQKLMAERRLNMCHKKDDKLQEGENDNASQDCPVDLKITRTKTASGTNLIKIEEVIKDKSENENNVFKIDLLDSIREVNIAKQRMLQAQLGVIHREKILMAKKRQCLEMGAEPDDVSLSPSPPSSPVHIDVERYDETESSRDHTSLTHTKIEEAKTKLSPNEWNVSNVSSKQGGNPCPEQNTLIKSTSQTDANKAEFQRVNAAKETTRKSKRIVENKGQLNAKSCMCSSGETKTARNTSMPVSETLTMENLPLSTSMTTSTNCIVSSQSLLRKHLTQKDKDATVTTNNNHVPEVQTPSSAVGPIVNTVGKPVLSSSNDTSRNVGNGHPQILNLTVPTDAMKSSIKLPDMPALVSHKNDTSDPVKTVVMPIGCVKDEGTNQVYPTYHYNGFTFALINNKMYHIRMNSSPTNPATTGNVGQSLPFPTSSTSNATIVMPAKPKLVPVIDANVSRSLVNIKPRVDVKNVTNTTSGVQLVTSAPSVSYRLPLNIVNSTSSSQPLNLVLVPAKTEGNIGNNVQIHGGQAVVISKAANANFIIGTNTVRGVVPRIIPRQIHPIPGPIPTVSIGSSVVASRSNVQPILRLTNQVQSANSSAIQSKFIDRASVKVIPSNLQLKSQTSKTRDKTQNKHQDGEHIDKNRQPLPHKVSSSESQCGSETSHKGGVRKSLSSETFANDVDKSRLNEQISRKRKRNKQKKTESSESVDNVLSGKPGEDIDEAVIKHKRKRKGTPPKKIHRKDNICDESSTQTSQVEEPRLLDEWMSEQEELKKKSEASEEDVTSDRSMETPVPFVNYPARIVSKQSDIDGSKIVSIVGSPNYVKPRNTCSSSDTSLNEEKMVKMLQFADEYEQEQKKKGECVVRKRSKFKRRKSIDSPKGSESASNDDSDAKIPKRSVVDNENMLIDYTGSPTAKEMASNMPEAKIDPSSHCATLSSNHEHICAAVEGREQAQQSPKEPTEEGRNVFDDIAATVPKQSEYSDKDTELDDQYDSSDFENYENFLLSKAKNSLKRKSQLIESYYTAEGLHERHHNNSKAVYKTSSDEPGVFSASEICDKVCENGEEKTNAKGACVEISYSSLVTPKENVGGEYSIAGASKSYSSVHLDKIRNLLPDINTVKNDKSVDDHSHAKCDTRLIDQSRNVVIPKTDGTPHDSTTVTCHTGVKKVCSLHQMPGSGSHSTGNTQVVDSNKCPCYVEKRFTKTKLIILKGEMCDRWMKIKKQTGFGEMSDPQFVQYLLRLEEERQYRMKSMLSELTEEDPLYYEDTGLSKEFSKALTSTPVCTTNEAMEQFNSSPVSSVVDLNNNNCCQSPVHEVDAMLDCSDDASYDDDDDDDDTIIDIVNMSTDSCTVSHDHHSVESPTHNTAIHRSDQTKLSSQRNPVLEEKDIPPNKTGVDKKRPMKMSGATDQTTSPTSKKQAARLSRLVTRNRLMREKLELLRATTTTMATVASLTGGPPCNIV